MSPFAATQRPARGPIPNPGPAARPHAVEPATELIDEIVDVSVDELMTLIERGDLMLPSVQTAIMALAYLRRERLLSS